MSQITDIKGSVQMTPGAPGASQTGEGSVSSSPMNLEPAGNSLPPQGHKAAKVRQAAMDQAVLQVNSFLQSQQRTLEFSVDKSTGRPIIKVIDQSTGKVLRQIPPEYIIRLAQTLQQGNGMSTTGIKIKT